MILIRGGRLLDPATGRDERADIVLEDNKIKEICRGRAWRRSAPMSG